MQKSGVMEEKLQVIAFQKQNKKLPTITFTIENLKPGTESWKSTGRAVKEAMEEFSFFIAVYDKLGWEMMSAVFASVRELFNLPKETKMLNTSDTPGFGYFGEMPHSPLHETMGIGDSTSSGAIQSFASLMWPFGNEQFCETIHGYTTQVSKLQQTVTRMIFESYGVGKYCDSHVESINYLLRANSYRVGQANETNVGLHPHTDTSFMSIVKQDEVDALEVQYSKDGTWIPVHFPPSSFAVIAGDALLAWSNGRIRPCFHRVIMTGKPRLSLGLFSFHKGIVQVPEELAADDDDGLLRFNSFDHLGLLKFRTRNPTLSAEERVRAYCGIEDDF